MGATSLKSLPQASVMCSLSTTRSLVGSKSTQPACGQNTETHACEASEPMCFTCPGDGVVRI